MRGQVGTGEVVDGNYSLPLLWPFSERGVDGCRPTPSSAATARCGTVSPTSGTPPGLPWSRFRDGQDGSGRAECARQFEVRVLL